MEARMHAALARLTSVALGWAVAGVFGSLAGCAQTVPRPEPAPSTLLMQQGMALAASGDDFAAEQYLEAARDAGYSESQVIRELVKVCVSAGKLERATSYARAYLERNPDDWIFHHVVASIYFATGDVVRARYELQQLLSEHAEHAESHFLLGHILREQGADFAGARSAFEQYLRMAPEGPHAREVRAWIRRSASFPVPTQKPVELGS
jgi:Flp pilus assembly protein TadD